MIIASGIMKVNPEKVDEARDAMKTLMSAVKKQPGYEAYVFAQSLEDPSLFHYFEKWDSAENMNANMASDHGAAFMSVMGGIVEKAEAKKYEGATEADFM